MKRWISLALMLLVPLLAWSQVTIYDTGTPANLIQAKATADGAQLTAELYGDPFQTSNTNILSATMPIVATWPSFSVTNANAASGTGVTPFSNSPYAMKWFRLNVTGAATNSPPWTVRFWGSMDGATYTVIMDTPSNANVTTLGQTVHMLGQLVARTWVTDDTLKFRGAGPLLNNGVSLPLVTRSGYPITHKFIIAQFTADSAIAGAAYVATVDIQARQH